MLTRVAIANYKSIGETKTPRVPAAFAAPSEGFVAPAAPGHAAGVDIELKPLTILVGPNGGGKSAILEAILSWAQWLSAASFPPLVPQLPQFQLSPDDLVHQKDKRRVISVICTLDTGESVEYRVGPQSQPEVVVKWTSDHPGQARSSTDATHSDGDEDRIRRRVSDSLFFLSAFRGRVDFEMRTGAQSQWVGPVGEHLILTLNALNEPDEYDQKEALTKWAQKFGIDRLWSGLERGHPAVRALYRDLGVWLPVAVASYGSRQVLPILVNLISQKAGSLHLIEEPEISLHPEHQVQILDFFAEMVRQKKKVMLTTHSHFLVSALGLPVQAGHIKAKDIAVYHVVKTQKGTTAQPLPLTDDGYIDGGIPSFAPVEDKLVREWAKTLKAG